MGLGGVSTQRSTLCFFSTSHLTFHLFCVKLLCCSSSGLQTCSQWWELKPIKSVSCYYTASLCILMLSFLQQPLVHWEVAFAPTATKCLAQHVTVHHQQQFNVRRESACTAQTRLCSLKKQLFFHDSTRLCVTACARVAGMVLMGVAAECTGMVQIPPRLFFNPGIAHHTCGSVLGLWEMSERWRVRDFGRRQEPRCRRSAGCSCTIVLETPQCLTEVALFALTYAAARLIECIWRMQCQDITQS